MLTGLLMVIQLLLVLMVIDCMLTVVIMAIELLLTVVLLGNAADGAAAGQCC
jgi:hypothetical protein